jgi:hypothetical protein
MSQAVVESFTSAVTCMVLVETELMANSAIYLPTQYFYSYSNITCLSVIVHEKVIWNFCCFGNSTSHWHMLLLQWSGRPLGGITSRVDNIGCTLWQKRGIYQQMWLWILKGNTENDGPDKIPSKWYHKMSFIVQWKTWTV